MIEYRKIWESINNESQSSDEKTQIARRVPSNGVFAVFLATDFKKGIRLLYVKTGFDHQIIIENLPRFRGLEVSLAISSIGEFRNQEFLKFTQSIPDTDNIFESVIADICEEIVHVREKKNLNAVLIRILNEWKLFFEKLENQILSLSEQKGLIGELVFLKEYLFLKYPYSQALQYWTGADRTNHDFQIQEKAIELKTTSGKKHKKFMISSEKQLDSTGLEHLYLVLFSFNIHNNMPASSLPILIADIYNIIQEDPVASFQFEIRLAKYGYNRLYSDKYTVGFSLSEQRFYEIADGFPRLLHSNLPDGVGDLKYTVMVASCSRFEIKTDFLELI